MIAREELAETVAQLCPMFILVDDSGHIERVGPTLQKLRPGQPLAGRRFLEVFRIDRPRAVASMKELVARSHSRLSLEFRCEPRTSFKGVIVPAPGGGTVVNLSFGISVLQAVQQYKLNSADFAVTDLAIELLYLVEAKSAAMSASRKLNERLKGAMIAAEEKAYTDTLTGLRNRRAVDYVLCRLLNSRQPFAVMNLDLDLFKEVNDTYGHAAGDHVLQAVARIMLEHTREEDTVGRVGGDEFVLIFNSRIKEESLAMIAEKLTARISEPIPFRGALCQVGASIGICMAGGGGFQTPDELLHRADLALYAAKRAGRGQYRFFDPMMEQGAATVAE
jgi:diguanylate cyclase (GGDEF)-like protein